MTAAASAQQATNLPPPTPFVAKSRTLNTTTWQRTLYELGASGQPVPHVQSYEEVASGLNLISRSNGKIVASSDDVEISPDGMSAAATNG
ncbi:MAG: hypothetical protein ACRED1_13015, partial [Limisphaerales bacterium]